MANQKTNQHISSKALIDADKNDCISMCVSLPCLITFSNRARLEINKGGAHWFYISRIRHNKACAVDRC